MKYAMRLNIIRISLAVAMIFGATNAFTMFSWFKKSTQKQENIVKAELAMLDPSNPANDRSKNFKLLYDLLLTLPPELIHIILDYKMEHTYTNERQLEKTISEKYGSTIIPAETPEHAIASYFHLPDQGYYINNIDPQTDAHQIKYLGQKNFREFLSSAPLKSQLPCDLDMLLQTTVDHEIKAWDSNNNEKMIEVKDEGSLVQFSGNRLVWGSRLGKLILMDPHSKKHPIKILADHNHDHILHIAKLSETIFVAVVIKIVAIENNSCNLQFWDLETEKKFLDMDINYVADYCTKLSEHSFALATGENNNVIEIWYWDLNSAQPIKSFKLPYRITALMALDNQLLIGSQGGMLALKNPLTGEHKGEFRDLTMNTRYPKAHRYPIESLFTLANGRVVSQAANQIKIWN